MVRYGLAPTQHAVLPWFSVSAAVSA